MPKAQIYFCMEGTGVLHVCNLCSASDSGSAVLHCRCGSATSALLMATSSGLLGAAIIAGNIAPQWAESEPFCITDGADLKSVRSEVVTSSLYSIPNNEHGSDKHRLAVNVRWMHKYWCPHAVLLT